jgi:hypothetical protein
MLKEKLTVAAIERIAPNPERKRNTPKSSILYRLCLWNHICAMATKESKNAWKAAAEAGVLKDDEELRDKYVGKGQAIVAESEYFSCVVEVRNPGTTFDKDMFIEKVAAKFKIDRLKLEAIAEDCKEPTKPSLSKKVLELLT